VAHIEAELTLLPTENGGRKGYAASGYRAQFSYAGVDSDAAFYFIGKDRLQPGETTKAQVIFGSPDLHDGQVFPGMVFLAREGNRVIGYGRVLRILELEEAARSRR
jgi:translation elongation factor EF-Tu-like GTPase